MLWAGDIGCAWPANGIFGPSNGLARTWLKAVQDCRALGDNYGLPMISNANENAALFAAMLGRFPGGMRGLTGIVDAVWLGLGTNNPSWSWANTAKSAPIDPHTGVAVNDIALHGADVFQNWRSSASAPDAEQDFGAMWVKQTWTRG